MPLLARRTILQAALATPFLAAGRASAATPFRFGLTPVLLDSDIALLEQMQVYLEEALRGPVDLIKRRTYQEITALLLTGELDAVWICGFPSFSTGTACRWWSCRSITISRSINPI